MDTIEKKMIKGGEFLIKNVDARAVHTPEDFTEEQLMMAATCKDFIDTEILPNLDRIDDMEEGLMHSLLKKAGDMGMLGISVPEEYGGLGMDFTTAVLSADSISHGHSFAVAFMAHTGIGTMPLMYYGNEEQKAKYLPKLASGEWAGAYCLTEPGAGSDANSGKTKAELTEDGKHYILNGQKMWITNAGFANLFTVFAKIGDDKNLTAFLVERDYEGVSFNPEEKKMGIKGSSTRQVFFNNVKVPVENLLYERDNGFKIALNILNVGRIKLGVAGVGAAKGVINHAVNYANEREQFGRAISKYEAIKYKLAEQAIRVFVLESAIYRASGDITNKIAELQSEMDDKSQAKLKGIEEFAIECAILKVLGSEVLDYVTDEGVQIYGGMGFSAESPMDRSYRDARINRIFEGTNEINRLLTVSMMLKKGLKGELDLMSAAKSIIDDLMSIPDFGQEEDKHPLAKERKYVQNFKNACLMVAGSVVQKLAKNLLKEQQIIMNIADILIEVYATESALLRVEKMIENGEENVEYYMNMLRLYIYDATDRVNKYGKDAINSFADSDELRMLNIGLKRYTKHEPFNPKEARNMIAAKMIAENKYCF